MNAAQDSSQQHLDYEEVEEGVHATARYSSFRRSNRGGMWGIEETRRFYEVYSIHFILFCAHILRQCLRQCGTDFSLMMPFFPKRTRQQLKKKFIRYDASF